MGIGEAGTTSGEASVVRCKEGQQQHLCQNSCEELVEEGDMEAMRWSSSLSSPEIEKRNLFPVKLQLKTEKKPWEFKYCES